MESYLIFGIFIFMKQSGIYKLENIVTNESYVGSSINLVKRKYEHFRLLKRNEHTNKHLQNSYNKHGERVFVFEILKECEKNECIYWEQYFIDYLSPKYNINPIAGSSLNVKHTKETIEKIRNTKMGHFVSEETKRKIMEKLKGRTRSDSEEIKKKRSEMMINHPTTKSRIKPILQLSLENEIIKKWNGSNEVKRELGYYPIHISRCCNGKRKTAYGYKWKFE